MQKVEEKREFHNKHRYQCSFHVCLLQACAECCSCVLMKIFSKWISHIKYLIYIVAVTYILPSAEDFDLRVGEVASGPSCHEVWIKVSMIPNLGDQQELLINRFTLFSVLVSSP